MLLDFGIVWAAVVGYLEGLRLCVIRRDHLLRRGGRLLDDWVLDWIEED